MAADELIAAGGIAAGRHFMRVDLSAGASL
jgi:hypothetical protein